MKQYSNYVAGRFVDAAGHGGLEVFNPASERLISVVPESSATEVGAAIAAASKAQTAWARLFPSSHSMNSIRPSPMPTIPS